MSEFDATDVAYIEETTERDICVQFGFVVDRWVVPIETSIYQYAIPDYVTNIRRLTYKGRQLNAYSGLEQRLSGSTPNRYSQGEPREYIYSDMGIKTIRLYPTPAETLSSSGDPWSGAVIREQCVMEFYRTPDTSDEYLRFPAWIRDQFLYDKVVLDLSAMDNQAFDSKTIKAYAGHWQDDLTWLARINKRIHQSEILSLSPSPNLVRNNPGRPQLPWQFGEIVP